MSGALPSPAAARRVLLTLTITRWFGVGLVAGLMVLWALDKGLSVPQAVTAAAFTGWVVFVLELPTSGFADAFGRRPVYVVAAAFGVAAATTYLLADSFAGFASGAVLMGVFRALDSGPLEAWFVDTVHRSEPDADVSATLATQSSLLGVSMASGALTSAGLVAWHPLPSDTALLAPFIAYVTMAVVHLAASWALLVEPLDGHGVRGSRRPGLPGAVDSLRATPGVVRDGVALLRAQPVLRALVLVEVSWSLAMLVFETFTPIRLAELLGAEERAGAWIGVLTASGWLVFAAGSSLAGRLMPRIGVVNTAILARITNGIAAATMGLAWGPTGLVAAYLAALTLHGLGGAPHSALLHREATAENRATVLSMNSMMMFVSYSASAPLVALLAGATSTQVAMVAAGSLSVLGALFYLPARRRAPQTDDARPSPVRG